MNKTVLIVWLVIGAICLGLGIAYGVQQRFDFMAIFIVAGVGTAIVGVMKYKRMKDEQNKKDDDK